MSDPSPAAAWRRHLKEPPMQAIALALAAGFLGKPASMCLLFLSLVTALLMFDHGLLHRGGTRAIGVAESLGLSAGHTASALALVLVSIRAKLFSNQLVGKLDPAISLGVTATLLAGGIVASLLRIRRPASSEP
jgi:tellurite resistance protein TerC